MLFRCSNDACSKTIRTGKDGSFHGDDCFKCGSKLKAVSFHYSGAEYDLRKIDSHLGVTSKGGSYTQAEVARRAGYSDGGYVSRQINGVRPVQDDLASTLLALLREQGISLDRAEFDSEDSESSVDKVEEALSSGDDGEEPSFPLKAALKIQKLTREGAKGGEVEATFGFRRLKLWQRAFFAFVAEGHGPRESLGAAYWTAHGFKLDDEGQLYAAELFQRVFGFDPDKPTSFIPNRDDQHPMEPVARLLATKGFHLYSYGETGDGKSFAMERVAREVSQHDGKIAVISGDSALSTEDFVASGAAKGDGEGGTETYTELRTLPLCMKRGMPLVMDEPCVVRPAILMSLQRVLETGELYVPQADIEISMEPGFCVFLTDNTRGLAEDPRYATRRVLDEAFRDRFLFLHFDSMPKDMATEILSQDASEYKDALSSDDDSDLADTATEDRRTEIVDESEPVTESEDSEDDSVNWGMLGLDN